MVVDPLRGLSVTWHLLPDISSLTAAMGRPPGRLMPVTAPNDHPPAGGASAHLPVDPTGEDPGLDRRLRASDPLAGVLPDDASTALVRRLAADVAAGALVPWSRRRQRRRATLTLLAAAILLCLAAGTPGIAHRLAAWTGIHGSGVGEEDTSEYLLTTAPDFRQALESLRPTHLPLPPGYEWRKADISTAFDLHEPTYVSATGIKDIYAGYAACTWEAEWLAGRRVGDTGRVRTATGVLAEARSWPDAGADKTGGARQARDQIATAAAHGDPGPLRQDLRVNCPPEWIRKGAR